MSETSDMIRKSFGESDDARDQGLTTPEDIVRYDDILYGQDARWQVLDVYRPKQAEGKQLPVIISVHGGGWVYGDKERYQFYCMNLAQRGFAVVNFTYRLAPEFKYPSAIEDTNMVFHWVMQHGAEYGMDTENIFAVGDSAGAQILSLYVAICTNEEYAGRYDFAPPKGMVPKAIALNCGAYRIRTDGDTDDLTQRLMADYLPEQGSKKELEMIQVESFITSAFPPTFFMTATGDFLKPQALVLAAKLNECNVPFVYRLYGDNENQLPHVFHCNIRSRDAKICNDEECDFFQSYITTLNYKKSTGCGRI